MPCRQSLVRARRTASLMFAAFSIAFLVFSMACRTAFSTASAASAATRAAIDARVAACAANAAETPECLRIHSEHRCQLTFMWLRVRDEYSLLGHNDAPSSPWQIETV